MQVQVQTIQTTDDGKRTVDNQVVENYFSPEDAVKTADQITAWLKGQENSWTAIALAPIIQYFRSWQSIYDM